VELDGFSFSSVDWSTISPTRHAGEEGEAFWRTMRFGLIRVRRVEYSAGYVADHWCSKGHILFVLEGELVTALDDGRVVTTSAGCSYQVADNKEAHRSSAPNGAQLLIVD
jgi:quercetin dioxygenase-like cupin family protein